MRWLWKILPRDWHITRKACGGYWEYSGYNRDWYWRQLHKRPGLPLWHSENHGPIRVRRCDCDREGT